MRIPELIQLLKTINVNKIVNQILKELRPEIIDMQTAQLEAGIDPDGDKFGSYAPYASKGYAEEKHHMNPKPGLGNPDLILTGSFRDKIRVTIRNQFVEWRSKDKKNDMLAQQYEPFGLTKENVEILIERVHAELEARVRKILKIAA